MLSAEACCTSSPEICFYANVCFLFFFFFCLRQQMSFITVKMPNTISYQHQSVCSTDTYTHICTQTANKSTTTTKEGGWGDMERAQRTSFRLGLKVFIIIIFIYSLFLMGLYKMQPLINTCARHFLN